MNLAFYTYFYGSDVNGACVIPEIPSLKYNCYYYTNNKNMLEKIQNTKWIGIYDDKPTNDDTIESNMVGKRIKAMPHEYTELKDYDYLCFLDSKLQRVNELFVEDFIRRFFIEQNYAFLLRKHWFVHGLQHEFNESMLHHRYTLEKDKYIKYIQNQLSNGFKENTEQSHCACGFSIRNMKHPRMIELNTTWYNHIQECGIQDQISFFFVKQLFEECIYSFSDYPFI
jgi:hypothetical protein